MVCLRRYAPTDFLLYLMDRFGPPGKGLVIDLTANLWKTAIQVRVKNINGAATTKCISVG